MDPSSLFSGENAISDSSSARFLAQSSPPPKFGLLRLFGCLLLVANVAVFSLLLTLARRRRTAIASIRMANNRNHSSSLRGGRDNNLGLRDHCSSLNEDSSSLRAASPTTSIVVTLDADDDAHLGNSLEEGAIFQSRGRWSKRELESS
jgi:hypothetical protein